jgi:hypothetical protein
MTVCETLREKMPEVAAGELQWSAGEREHVATCPACAAEWRLVQAAREIGAPAAGRVDPARLTGVVLTRVAAARRAARWKRGGWLVGLATAAGLAFVLLGRSGPAGGGPGATPALPAAESGLPVAELDGLDAGQLESVLDQIEVPLDQTGTGPVPSMGDLDDHQLERVLRSLEG